MDQKTVDLRLELRVTGDDLTGQIENGGGGSRSFRGWLGLIATLDGLIAEATETDNDSQSRRTR